MDTRSKTLIIKWTNTTLRQHANNNITIIPIQHSSLFSKITMVIKLVSQNLAWQFTIGILLVDFETNISQIG
ncbi:hypothetical protein Hanom_Chr09g00826141 [Helianthus anomalus]